MLYPIMGLTDERHANRTASVYNEEEEEVKAKEACTIAPSTILMSLV